MLADMASTVSLNALDPNLNCDVQEDRSSRPRRNSPHDGADDDGTDTDADQVEVEMQEMNQEDAEYLDGEEIMDEGLPVQRRRHEIEGNVESRDFALPRTSSPESNADLQVQSMPRTVTINEDKRDSMEDRIRLPASHTPSQRTIHSTSNRTWRRPRTLSLPRTPTSSSIRTFSTFVEEHWDRRRDKSSGGFLARLARLIFGEKDGTNTHLLEDQPDYVPPKYRWTPILSGLLQPFSILLEIPGLTEHWYVRTVNNVPVVYQPNPVILDVGLAISVICAVIANIALISRFLERRVLMSTIVTIIGLSIHDLINIVAVTTFGIVHRFNDGFTYSEAFWLCVCSTVASMFTNGTLIYDLIKTRDFRRSGSGLTAKQRSLVIIVMILLVYMAIGALCFNYLLPDIPFQNALYFTVVSIETIGFGDITPHTLGAKIFLFFYAPIGILNLAVTVGTARDTLIESWSAAYRRRRFEVLRRHRERKQQKADESIRRAAIERQLIAIGEPKYVSGTRSMGLRGVRRGKKLNSKALSIDQLNMAESQAMNEIASKSSSAPSGTAEPFRARADTLGYEEAKANLQKRQNELTTQSLLSEEGYRGFRDRMAKEERRENVVKVCENDHREYCGGG